MELTDILSYIATGQPASEALQLGGAGQSIASTGAGFAKVGFVPIVELMPL